MNSPFKKTRSFSTGWSHALLFERDMLAAKLVDLELHTGEFTCKCKCTFVDWNSFLPWGLNSCIYNFMCIPWGMMMAFSFLSQPESRWNPALHVLLLSTFSATWEGPPQTPVIHVIPFNKLSHHLGWHWKSAAGWCQIPMHSGRCWVNHTPAGMQTDINTRCAGIFTKKNIYGFPKKTDLYRHWPWGSWGNDGDFGESCFTYHPAAGIFVRLQDRKSVV